MVSQACYTTSDGRRYSRPYPLYFSSPTERRFPMSPHDNRVFTMADHQLDADSAPQRKRIAVACLRCRKRKIRCSGDPGHGQPCSNCKNAGVENCQFLRVSSREAPMRLEAGDFGYSVGDARLFAGRASVQGNGLQYTQDPSPSHTSSQDILGSYRGASTYAYTPPSKTYYPAMHAYAPSYGDEFEFGLGVPPSQSVLNPEPVGILPGQWSSGIRTKPGSFNASVYLDAEAPYSSYSGTSLVHRPGAAPSSESPNFSFSNVAASLPMSNAPPGQDRLLPNPAARSSPLPYPAVKPSISGAPNSSTLADVATAATYAAGAFESSGLPYSASTATHQPGSSSSRSNSDSYSAGPESIFSEQERGSLQSQSSASFELSTYSAEPRRGSGGEGEGGGGPSRDSSSSHGHGYGQAEGIHEAAATGHGSAHHHSSHHHHISSTGYNMGDGPSSPHGLRHGQSSSGPGLTHLGERNVAAVATRH